jgi:hypothetical protein
MFPFQGSSSSSVWIITPIANFEETLIFNIYRTSITELPNSKAFYSIFVVVDQLTKMAHFMPCNKTITDAKTSRLFIDNIYKYHGLPDDIISDQGS